MQRFKNVAGKARQKPGIFSRKVEALANEFLNA